MLTKNKGERIMNKKKARVVLVGIVALLALLIYTSAVGIGKTGTGSARNIKLGLDLSGGVSITYQAVSTSRFRV